MTIDNSPLDNPPLFDKHFIMRQRQALFKDSLPPSVLHREIARRLLERLDEIKLSFLNPLILGHRPHDLVSEIEKQKTLPFNQLIIQEPALIPPIFIPNHQVIHADYEDFQWEGNQFDLILSNLILHWVDALPQLLQKMQSSLKPNGLLLASMIGGRSLSNLRQALIMAENELSNKVSPRISPMVDVPDAGRLLQYAGFALPMVDKDILRLPFKNFFQALKGLKQIGEGNALIQRSKQFPSKKLFFVAADYWQQITDQDPLEECILDFEILYLLGWKPDPSQSKPIARGSAEQSLKSVL